MLPTRGSDVIEITDYIRLNWIAQNDDYTVFLMNRANLNYPNVKSLTNLANGVHEAITELEKVKSTYVDEEEIDGPAIADENYRALLHVSKRLADAIVKKQPKKDPKNGKYWVNGLSYPTQIEKLMNKKFPTAKEYFDFLSTA